MKSNNSIKTGKNSLSLSLSKCLKSLALFFKSIPTFFLNLISPVKLQTSQIKLNRSHTKAHNTFLTLFVGAGSFLVAFIFGSLLLIPGDSSAEESIATLSNDPTLAVAITPENLNLSIAPTPSGSLSADELNINVNTDNETGYVMSLASANETTDLTDVNTSSSIHSTTATTDNPAVLSANTWGWYPNSLVNNPGYNNSNPADSNYQFAAIPSYDDPYTLKQTTSATTDTETIPVSIAANVGTSLPAGTYSNIITITTITNYVPRPILDVYPTTGWAGDTITLYSNDGFINVTSVTVGGTECTSINLVSQDELQCVLPDKTETNPDSDNGYNITVTASGTELDTHNFTIRYFNPSRTETASVSNTQITNINMDTFTSIDCGSLSVGDIVSLTDERNGQTYRIKKMQDEKCWMVDNMKYLGEGITISNVDGTSGIVYDVENMYNTVDGNYPFNNLTSDVIDKAFYNNPMVVSYCYGDSIQSSYTKCGYLYNWYATTAGTGTYATSTDGTNVSGSICPTGWRLPSATSDGSTATGNGISFTVADFAVLNASMNAGSLTTGSISSYPAGWQFTGEWYGIFSGQMYGGLKEQGSDGHYWSSTADSARYASYLRFTKDSVSAGNVGGNKFYGNAVRCMMDPPKEEIYVEDVYPTTGWSGNTVKITLNQIPSSGIQSVTIGGTACTSTSISDNTVSCTLPSKSASTDGYAIDLTANNIEFDSHNFTVRYFNPSRTETIGSSTTSNITMQSFTRSNCNAMTVGQVVSLTDSRNKQTYRIKKMQDNKCWMVDNLKYAGEANTDLANVDGTYGLVYNNESGKYNTVDGTRTQSSTNFDKAFYNNPMSRSYCYGTSIQSSYTKCGYLYNWYAATAGTGTYATSTRGTNVSGSICPTGWRLPSGSSDGSTATGNGLSYNAADFPVLNASMNAGSLTTGSTSSYLTGWLFTGAWSGVFSGSWSNGFGNQGSFGHYWSSTAVSSTNARYLSFSSSDVNPANNLNKYYGRAVRCVMEEPPAIQDFTVDECRAKASDTNFTVVDKRDGSDYAVRYINGNCWMTQNLRLSGGRTLTSADSNVASSWSFPSTSLTSGDSYTEARSLISSNTSYGGYYNYCAASAGTVCSQTRQDATYDICPKGWRLPTITEQQGIRSYSSAFSPVYSGRYNDGSLNFTGTNGYWWSSTAITGNSQYNLYYRSGRLGTESLDKNLGFSVRCVRSS